MMSKPALIILLVVCAKSTYAQKSILEFKKGRKVVSGFWEVQQ